MQNHVHFLVQIKEDIEELSKFFHKLNTMYARYYNYMEEGRVGYVYRDRFLSEPITSHRYLVQCIKYIHFNPVKAKLVKKCEDYKFSSYRFFKKRLEIGKYNSILSKEDYENICNNNNYNMNFLDVEIDKEEKIKAAIEEFLEVKNRKIYEIFSNRKILEKMVLYLKNERGIKYIEIRDFLEMTRGTMQRIMLKNKEKN